MNGLKAFASITQQLCKPFATSTCMAGVPVLRSFSVGGSNPWTGKKFFLSRWFDTFCSSLRFRKTLTMSGGRFCLFFSISLIFFVPNSLYAASLDGTSTLVYKSNLQIFRNGLNEYVRGFVRLDNGIAVGPSATAFMDTNISVSGPFDLGETGMMVLQNCLYTDGLITLTSSGSIKGKATVSGDAKTIFLGGDLTLGADSYAKVLHITGDWSNSGTSGDLIIDGCGHTLNIGDRAQIFVDTNVTLTLRNMTIMTGAKSLNNSPIQLAALGSKLALDNVMFDLGADFHFVTGQIFVHNEVAVTGTSAFVYQSPRPSYITFGATWFFDPGTTFSVAPSTFTDCPYTVNNTYTNNNFIVLADQSSTLSLNSCSFKTTYTGVRFTKGMLMFDNRVVVDTVAGADLASTGTTPVGYVGGATQGNQSRSVAWSPDSRFVAITDLSPKLSIYRINNNSAPIQVGSALTIGTTPDTVVWSPDGRFLAATAWSSANFQVYRFNGSSTPTTVGAAASTGANPNGLQWAPDGRFLAVVNISDSTLQIYRFNGISTPVTVGGVTTTGTSPYGVTWSPDGRFVAVVSGSSSHTLQVYRFNGTDRPRIIGSVVAAGTYPYRVQWSSDGRFLAAINNGNNTLQVYRFYGTGSLVAVGSTATTGSSPVSLSWSPDGRFLAVGSDGSDTIQIYRFNGSNTPTLVTASTIVSQNPLGLAWSPDGNFIAAADNSSPKGALRIFRCNYVYTGQPAQSFTNGLVFGQSALGSGYNVDVNVAGSARVEINGKVSDDSA